ncbi:YggS family pyridoxal phosphate-dependent enzyme [Baaleninema sp.]|uniref:YggS family pyridoxal phosphate-dependent enzyme n=1 Tax=Baaleninema sp. TaxID=3101197 RepID=UPI003D072CD0
MPDLKSIAANLAEIRQSLPESVRLVAVTKTLPAEAIREAYAAGVRDFGESRIQEAIAKQDQLSDLDDITWHFIGHLQTNKTKQAIEHMDWIHSVDRFKLVREIDRLVRRGSPSPKLCLQVKLRQDPNKSGWSVEELLQDLPKIEACDRLNLQGLMTIPPMGLDAAATAAVFNDLRQLRDRLNQRPEVSPHFKELSMGMSADYPIAVECGATMVRLGRVIFGERRP